MEKKYKIAFLFLDEIHHLYHFITVAVELSRTQEVSILTYPSSHELLRKSIKELDGSKIKIEELPTSAFRAFTDKLKRRILPRKGFWIKKNKKYIINTFDAVVFTDYFHKYFLKSKKEGKPKLLMFEHGTPSGAYAFNESQLDFDYQQIIGEFHYNQFKALGILGSHPVVVGYPKFDAVNWKKKENLFKNDKPTVLYNPHFKPHLSSWKEEGLNVLEFFYNNPNYNLIFAPHIHLFQEIKGGHSASEIPGKFFESTNIHIDLGSTRSVNMTYLHIADIYLGDVSSQVYEFIITPRPCVFLNSNDISYSEDFTFRLWKCGQVITSTENFDEVLKEAVANFSKYRPIQEQITAENYYTEEGSTASERAAKAIISFLDKA